MCRVLVSLKDYEVLHVIEDGQEFGSKEVPPIFGVIEVPRVGRGDFLNELRKEESVETEKHYQSVSEKVVLERGEELVYVHDKAEYERLLTNYIAKELEGIELHYKLSNLPLSQREALQNGSVHIPSLAVLKSSITPEVVYRKPRITTLPEK